MSFSPNNMLHFCDDLVRIDIEKFMLDDVALRGQTVERHRRPIRLRIRPAMERTNFNFRRVLLANLGGSQPYRMEAEYLRYSRIGHHFHGFVNVTIVDQYHNETRADPRTMSNFFVTQGHSTVPYLHMNFTAIDEPLGGNVTAKS